MSGWGDLRLVPAAIVAWGASLLAQGSGVGMAIAVVGAALVASAAAAVLPRTRALAPGLALAAVAGAVAACTALAWSGQRDWISEVRAPVEVRGRVAEVRELVPSAWSAEPRVVVRIAVSSIRTEAAPWRPAAGTLVLVADSSAAPTRGGGATARGTVAPAARGRVDGLLEGILVETSPPGAVAGAIESARGAFVDALGAAPPASGALVRGMVLGDTSAMPDPTVERMRVSGLSHLTAVSGAHFAIVAAAVGGLARRLRAGPVLVALVTLTACGALGAAVSGGGSVVRALGMATVASVALVAGRRHEAVPALAATALVLVVASPGLARDVGLGLSVSAVAGIALLVPSLAHRLSTRMAQPLAEVAAMTLAAQTACLPLLAVIAADVGPWAVAANVVSAPFAIPVTLLGVAALAVAVALPGLAEALVTGASWCAWPVLVAARAFAAAPGSGLRWPDGAPGVVAGSLLLAALAVAARATGRAAARGIVLAGAVAALATSPAIRSLPPALGGPVQGWTVVACDVGQGDALVVRAGGATVMIDAGPPGAGAADCLDRLGVARVDLLVLSHEHADHTGGVAAVVASVPVRRVWLPPGPSERTLAATAGLPVATPASGDAIVLGGVAVTVVQVGDAPSSRDGSEVNDSSVVLRLEAGGVSVAALGDLEIAGQRALLARGGMGAVDVVKMAHHGSAEQLPEVAVALDPTLALVSVGSGNDYGHPTEEALAAYEAAGAVVLRTDLCGDLVIAARASAPALVRRCQSAVAG